MQFSQSRCNLKEIPRYTYRTDEKEKGGIKEFLRKTTGI
jgi:hypothetical protein